MNMNFYESYKKSEILKGIILICIFLFCCFAPFSLIETITKNNFIINNIEFVTYGILFILSLLLYHNVLQNSIKNLRKENLKFSIIVTFFIIVLIVLSAILLDKIGVINTNEENLERVSKNGIFVFYAIASVFFGPVVEELIYRYFIFRFFRKYSVIFAHILVALIFAFMHFANYFFKYLDFSLLLNMLPYLFMSLGLSITYEKTKSLFYPIIIHMAINAIATFN